MLLMLTPPITSTALAASVAFLLVTTLAAPASAASYQKTDGSIVDPILFVGTGNIIHPYSGADLQPGLLAPGLFLQAGQLQNADLNGSELIGANLGVEAGRELRAGESAFLKRHPRAKALAILLDRYRKAGNFNRPWMMAVVHGGSRALNAEPKGRARVWWEHAYPRAYRNLVEKHKGLGKNPDYYLYSIMRKESGFNPHVHSYADAIGLLQMIPPTTR